MKPVFLGLTGRCTTEVAVCVMEKDRRFPLVKEGNPKCRGKYGLPGGERDYKRDKNLEDTVIRETSEETGLEILPTDIICLKSTICDGRNIIGIAYYAKIVGGKEAPGPEILELGWFSLEQIEEMFLKGELRGEYVLDVIKHYVEKGKIPIKELVL